jgi:tRNA splicing endonuclease
MTTMAKTGGKSNAGAKKAPAYVADGGSWKVEIPLELSEELFRKRGFGEKTVSGISLHIYEAKFAIDTLKIPIPGADTIEKRLSALAKKHPLVRESYEVFVALRKNGYIARPSFSGEPLLRVYRKGFRPGEDRTICLLKVVEPEDKITFMGLLADAKKASDLRKEFAYAFIDSGTVRFMKCGRTNFD